ncbi:MAG: zinc ribbon domain-containing protein [Lachnospiraceae bacterium]|nr:zinc ribbon domain-containing protein [Lachnospiraceae bacterium]
MFCTICGKQLADGTVFCPNCGSRVTIAPDPAPAPVPAPAPIPSAAPTPIPVIPAPVYSNPELANRYTAPTKKENVWPAACGVMAILALAFYIMGYLIILLVGEAHLAFPYLTVIAFIAMAVIFFAHTRKIPWVTIIPFLIQLIFTIYQNRLFISDVFSSFKGMNGTMLTRAVITFLPMILFILYVLITLLRPRGAALRVIFLILSLIQVIVLFIGPMVSLNSLSELEEITYVFNLIFGRIALVFFYIGYAVAGMNVRKPA